MLYLMMWLYMYKYENMYIQGSLNHFREKHLRMHLNRNRGQTVDFYEVKTKYSQYALFKLI